MSKTLTIKWVMPEEGIVKFNESDINYDITDAVAGFASKAQFKNGETVEVEIDENEGSNGTVTKISRKSGSQPTESKPEVHKEEKSNVSENSKKVMTVAGISYKTNAATFEEDEGKWYSFAGNLKAGSMKKFGIEKGTRVELAIGEPEKDGGNKMIKFIKVAEGGSSSSTSSAPKSEPAKTEAPKNDYSSSKKSTYTSDTQVSIEAQAAVNAANATVSRLLAGKLDVKSAEDGKLLKSTIASVANSNYDLIQELKRKA